MPNQPCGAIIPAEKVNTCMPAVSIMTNPVLGLYYSRRGNRSPRLCYKTERARFQALGSSVVWLLSRVPCNQGLIDRRLELGKQFALHLYIGRIAVFITYALLLVSLSSKLPSSRQPICGITHSISFSRNLSLSLLAAWLPAQ